MNNPISTIGYKLSKNPAAMKAWAKEAKDNGYRKRFAVRYTTYGGTDKLSEVMTAIEATAFAKQMAYDLVDAFAEEAAGNFVIHFSWNNANRPHLFIDGGRGPIAAVGVVIID